MWITGMYFSSARGTGVCVGKNWCTIQSFISLRCYYLVMMMMGDHYSHLLFTCLWTNYFLPFSRKIGLVEIFIKGVVGRYFLWWFSWLWPNRDSSETFQYPDGFQKYPHFHNREVRCELEKDWRIGETCIGF